jgi:hypothetical protein
MHETSRHTVCLKALSYIKSAANIVVVVWLNDIFCPERKYDLLQGVEKMN